MKYWSRTFRLPINSQKFKVVHFKETYKTEAHRLNLEATENEIKDKEYMYFISLISRTSQVENTSK